MYRGLLQSLENNVGALLRVLHVHDSFYAASAINIVTKNPDGTESDPVRIVIDKPVEWKQYDHCALILRLYALYEGFVDDLIGSWLSQLPKITTCYAELPEKVKQQHRIGISHLLNRIGGEQYSHLSEDRIVGGLYHGVKGENNYDLPPDVFLTESKNYWWNTLIRLFGNVGIDELKSILMRDTELSEFIKIQLGESESIQSQVNKLVGLRNTAAHDEVTETLSTGELITMANFVVCLCQGLARAVEDSNIRGLIRCGKMRECGHVVNRFKEHVFGIESNMCQWRVGLKVAAKYNNTYRFSQIESIEVDNQPYIDYEAKEGTCIGMRLTDMVSMRSKIYLLLEDVI